MVKQLLAAAGFNADSKREDGQVPLSWAAQGLHEAMVKLLVATAGVNVDSKDEAVSVALVVLALLPRLDDATEEICRRLA